MLTGAKTKLLYLQKTFKMKHIFSILFIFGFLIQFPLSAQNPYRGEPVDCSDIVNLAWVKTAGSINSDGANGIVTDHDGNIIITGYFTGEMNFQGEVVTSAGGMDFFIAKLDSDGNLIWIKTTGGAYDDYGKSVAVDNNNNIFVTGTFQGFMQFDELIAEPNSLKDIFLIKYSSDGNALWGEYPGGNGDDYPGRVVVDGSDNVLICGTYDHFLYIGGSSRVGKLGNDFFVAKYDNNGDFSWWTNDGSDLNESAVDLAVDDSGNAYVTGDFSGELFFGSFSVTSFGASDVFLAKYNSAGVFQWAKQSGASGNNDIAGGVAADNSGNVYLYYKKDIPGNMARIEKYSSSGTELLNTGFGSNGLITPKSIITDNSQNIYVTGMFSGTSDLGEGDVTSAGEGDYFFTKFYADGSFKFNYTAGSSLSDCGNSICLDADNNIFIGGFYNDGIDFGSESHSSQGEEDIMIVKYDRFFSFGDIIVSSHDCIPNDMCIDITVSGGTPPFTFEWSDGQTDEDVCNLSPGTMSVTVTDANTCFIETSIELTAPTGPEIDLPSFINACPFDTTPLNAGAGNYEYLWDFGAPPENQQQIIYVFEAGDYSVTVTDITSGCSSTATAHITKLPAVPLFDTDTIEICAGSETTLTPHPGFSVVEWSDGSSDQELITGVQGLFWVKASNSVTGCNYYDSIVISHYPKPVITPISDKLICTGDSTELIATEGFEEYLWSNGVTTQSYWENTGGIVMVTVTDVNGCQTSDTVLISTMDPPVISLGEDTTYCTNNSVILDPHDSGTGNSYTWSTGSLAHTITVSTSDTYWVEVSNAAECKVSDTIELIIHPQPVVNLGPDIVFCDGESRIIKDNDNSFDSYIWSNGSTEDSVTVTEAGIYSVTVSNEFSCKDSDTVLVTVNIIPTPFIGYDTVLCSGDIHILKPESEYLHYIWNNGSHESSLSVSQAGLYSLTVSDNIGCSASSSLHISYTEGPSIVSVHSGGGNITINATGGTPPLLYSYDGDTWLQSNVFQGLESGTYTVWVMDKNYCIITIETFLDQSINVPSFFTPNGDGYNDYWVISGLYHYPDAEIEIFDRFGKKLYQFSGSEFGWNGNYMGLPLPSDTYWYTIRLKEDLKPLTGNVTIKR